MTMQKEETRPQGVFANRFLEGRTKLIVIVLAEVEKISISQIADAGTSRTIGDRRWARKGGRRSQVLNGHRKCRIAVGRSVLKRLTAPRESNFE